MRYHDRTESWFELLTIKGPPRRDLRILRDRLAELEPPLDGAQWCADSPMSPIPELYFGAPGEQAYGQITRKLLPSQLSSQQIELQVRAFFAEAATQG